LENNPTFNPKKAMPPKSNRLKPAADIASATEFNAVLDGIANDQLLRDALVLDRDQELLKIRDEFDPQINQVNERMNAALLRAERYAMTHRESLFGKLKSAASALTVFGFRLGNPTLKLLNRKWNWEQVLDALKSQVGGKQFIIVKEAPDKDAMKAKLRDDELAAVGCRVEQGEVFFVEPKRDTAADQRIATDGKAVA
jgi:phage host-nuclease inhibitor protein Gam